MTRFAQLTYTSFDRHDGRGGGWQVKDMTGGIDPEDGRVLCGRVATQLDPGVEMPRFPTPAEVAELPHQMVHAPLELSGGPAHITWHTAPAGYDASGRPGNVFAHVLVDRAFDPADGVRPIERWRSPDWLAPFGPDGVLAATLRPTVPGPGPVDRRTVASWLFAPRQWRTNTLAAILDALAERRAGGRPVVVATEDVDEAANWIAAVSLCSSVGVAGDLTFSTLERAAGLTAAVAAGLELICIPHRDTAALARDSTIVLIDSSEHVEIGDLGGVHRTSRGDEITVTAWSAMVLDLFADPDAMVARVSQLDEVAATVGDRGLHPLWPAAVLISRDPDGDLRHEAVGVLSEHSPANLKEVDDLFAGVAGNLASETSDTASAWEQVVRQGAHDDAPERNRVLAETAVAVYADHALGDVDWLRRSEPMELPARHLRPREPRPQWLGAAARQLQHRDPVVVLHTMELVLRLGLDRDPHLKNLVNRAAHEQLAPLLVDERAGRRLAAQVTSVGVEARHLLWSALSATPVVRQRQRPPGALIPGRVVDLLGPGPGESAPFRAHDPATRPGPTPPLLVELAFRAIRAGDDREVVRAIAAWAQLEAGVDPKGAPLASGFVSELMRPCWTPARMAALTRRFGNRIPLAWHLPHLMGATDDAATEPSWRPLWQHLASHANVQLGQLATLRLEIGEPPGPIDAILAQIDAIISASPQESLSDPEAIHRAHLLLAAALLHGASTTVPPGFDQPVGPFTALEVRQLADWGQQPHGSSTLIPLGNLLGVLARGAAGSPLYEPVASNSAVPDRGADRTAGDQAAGDRAAAHGPTSAGEDSQPWLFALTTMTDGWPEPLVAALILDRVQRAGSGSGSNGMSGLGGLGALGGLGGASEPAAEVLAAVPSIPGIEERQVRDMERWLNGWLRHQRRREGK